MSKSQFKIVLHSPDIPGNTGSIGRTCVALNLELILIHPLGFELSEKAVRRAGLDYWKYVQIKEYQNWEEYLEKENPKREEMYLFSKTVDQSYYDATYVPDGHLIFGSETSGLPKGILEEYHNRVFSLPMYTDKIRSINLSNAMTAASYEAIRQLNFS
jgi:tRNA (cytidine/uridine-2'-O-)-methyltransferase